MAKLPYCPVLSKTSLTDSGATGAMVRCKGKACALFIPKTQTCALDDIPTVGGTSEVMAAVEEVPSTEEMQAALDGIARVEEMVMGSTEDVGTSLASLTEEVKGGSERIQKVIYTW